jgi:tripartite-type tricarboxylate transporter receptor subunit TctC
MPGLPTMDEAGVPGFEASTWAGLLMPAGTPQPILDKFHADLLKVYAMPDMKERMANGGFQAVGNSPKEFAAYLDMEVARWEKVIRAAGIRAE